MGWGSLLGEGLSPEATSHLKTRPHEAGSLLGWGAPEKGCSGVVLAPPCTLKSHYSGTLSPQRASLDPGLSVPGGPAACHPACDGRETVLVRGRQGIPTPITWDRFGFSVPRSSPPRAHVSQPPLAPGSGFGLLAFKASSHCPRPSPDPEYPAKERSGGADPDGLGFYFVIPINTRCVSAECHWRPLAA